MICASWKQASEEVSGCLKEIHAQDQKNMIWRNKHPCEEFAHPQMKSNNKCYILQSPEFKGMSCFDIAHDNRTNGLLSPSRKKDFEACKTYVISNM